MRRALLPLLFAILLATPAAAQYNWDAHAMACGWPACADFFVQARGTRLTVHLKDYGDASIPYFLLNLPGELDDWDYKYALAGGDDDGFYVDQGRNSLSGFSWTYYDGTNAPTDALSGTSTFWLRLLSPVSYLDADVSGVIDGVYFDPDADTTYCDDEAECEGYVAIKGIRTAAADITQVTPEPVSMVLLATGLFGIAAARRRRQA